MVARRLFSAASAWLLTSCPAVVTYGRESGGECCFRWTRKQHLSHKGVAWIGPTRIPSTYASQRQGLQCFSPWWAGATWSSASSTLRPNLRYSTAGAAMPVAKRDLRHLRHAAAAACGGDLSMVFPSRSNAWLARRRMVPGLGRGHSADGLRLGAVTAVSSPEDGPIAATAAAAGAESAFGERSDDMREVFEAATGEDGLLGLVEFRALQDVRELLDDGLLAESEVVEIWKAVPKADADADRMSFDGFSQAFARIDALFEEEDDEEEVKGEGVGSVDGGVQAPSGGNTVVASFEELAGSSEGLLDLAGLLRWREVTELIDEGLLTRVEAELIWDGLPKVANSVSAAGAPGTDRGTLIDLEGFLEFDRKLSDLFEEEEEERGDGETGSLVKTSESPSRTPPDAFDGESREAPSSLPFVGEDSATEGETLEDQFVVLADNATGEVPLLTLDSLLGWSEVSELVEDGLLTREEVEGMFRDLPKAGDGASVDLKGFVEFATKLESMFEEVADGDEECKNEGEGNGVGSSQDVPGSPTESSPRQVPAISTTVAAADGSSAPSVTILAEAGEADKAEDAKERLVILVKGEMEDCGMGCGEEKRAKLLEATESLIAAEKGNLVLSGNLGSDLIPALVGEWRLLYTSSNAMEYNQGLTGLANTIPNAKFCGLRQILHADGMVFDAEYEEELSIRDESEPLVITVTSDWEVKQTSSLITGKSTVAVSVSPKEIKYGFITVRSERWKTLRSMTLLDIAYLDADLRIMRGQTARQNVFVFKKVIADPES